MTNKQQYIENIVNPLKKKLGLSDWIINIEINDGFYPEETTCDGGTTSEDKECEAAIWDDLKYLEANLVIYKPFWDRDHEHQVINLTHELVHLLLCPLHPYTPHIADDVFEGVVQKLAISFHNSLSH